MAHLSSMYVLSIRLTCSARKRSQMTAHPEASPGRRELDGGLLREWHRNCAAFTVRPCTHPLPALDFEIAALNHAARYGQLALIEMNRHGFAVRLRAPLLDSVYSTVVVAGPAVCGWYRLLLEVE